MRRLGEKMGLTGEERARLWQVLKAEQREAKKQNEAPARWLRECRKCVGQKMVQYVNDDGARWDLYTLVKVMQGHLRQAFVGRLGLDEYPAKELLTRLLHAAEGRNQRAHERQPTEAEVVETLGQMKRALEVCSFGDAASKMADLLAETQRLVDAARKTADDASACACEDVALERSDFEALLLYRAFLAFEPRLREHAGPFEYKTQTINFPNIESEWGNAADFEVRQTRIRKARDKRDGITEARHWLFHNTDAVVDTQSVRVHLHARDCCRVAA